ncbi:MAG: hypothetical protein GX122_08690 [Candidatus Cloacimonetes bacterium]|nr:hypothetical protein [Candidatus Cloacimonadota bacterium]
MANITIEGFILYLWTPTRIRSLAFPTGQINYTPETKYRHEVQNAFDPTILHRSGKYYEDTFRLTVILTPVEYRDLKSILTDEGKLYIEYQATPTTRAQYPVRVKSLPVCPDDLHEYVDQTDFVLVSTYLTTPQYIDFGLTAITQDDDIIVTPPVTT